MTIRVAHLSGLWKAGATAMVRIHNGLSDLGVRSAIHCASPVDDSLHNAFTLPEVTRSKAQRWKTKLLPDQNAWSRRIAKAAKGNPAFEAFSPPVALTRHDLSGVLADVDVLHLHWAGGFIDFPEFFAQVSVPVVWTLHDQNPYLGGFHYQSDVDTASSMLPLEYECRDIKRQALAGIDLALAGNSDWNTTNAKSTGVLPRNAIAETIYLPLPIDDYQPLPKADSKQALGIADDRFVIGFACAAMNNRRKGFVNLIDALDRLPETVRRRVTLVSFGHQPGKSLRKRVTLPWVHCGTASGGLRQSPIYSAMDTFVIPSLEEAFGQTALEALACQTPVVGTSVGGIPEIVQAGKTGLLAPPRCPQLLADRIEELFADPHRRMRLGIQGRRLAEQRHAPEVIAQAHLSLYQRLLYRRSSDRWAA